MKIKEISLKQYKDFPYCIVGYSSIPDNFSITLKAQGLKEMVKKLKDDDTLRITIFSGTRATEFKIIREVKNE
jgi:DNA polymerase III sliding clamp (beta) subunit (PCNA family)